MKRRATLKDISKALNISITTVSRALNDKEDISASTKRAVLDVANILNYRPNAMAVSLRKKSADDLIGVILPSVEHYFYSTILNGVMTAAGTGKFLIIVGESNNNCDREKVIINQFSEHYVSGIILAPTRDIRSRENLVELETREIPYILIDRTFEDYKGSYVQYDDFRGGFTATEHLIFQGRKRIAHIKGDDSCVVSSERFRGYCHALKSHKIPFRPELVRSCFHANKEEGYDTIKSIFAENQLPPDAIFTVTDDIASGCFEYIAEQNLRIPDDLAIVGYSNSEISQHLSPRLTTIEQNGREMGTTAYNFLVEQIKNPLKICQKIFGSHLIIRNSSRKTVPTM